MKKQGTKTKGVWLFTLAVILLYMVILLVNPTLFSKSAGFFARIFLQMVPIFALVFVLMTISNLFMDRPVIIRYFKRPGISKWFFVIVAGIVSTGPIYVWYPLLAELRDKGVGYGYLATFLYNRAIKVPLLPVAIFYFGLKYIVVLTVLMVVFSIIQGVFINRVIPAEG